MTERRGLEELVPAARSGDQEAWAELVARYQDRAMATALGWSGRWHDAADIAQEAFRLAYLHLSELEEPAAFGAWFARVVRTACSRQQRRHQLPSAPLSDAAEALASPEVEDPLVKSEEEAAIRSAVEALPDSERVVIALFYLAELGYPQIAEFLGIGLSSAKKRGATGRRRLKELLPMTAEILSQTRPSRTNELRDTVLLFSAIHHRDTESVRGLVSVRPSRALATEDWTPQEAADAEIGFSQQATALIRAAETGIVEMAQVLLDAGAPVDGLCDCDGGETPLWAASVAGLTEMVRFLLSAGADPNAAAFRGATALHAAVVRDRHDIIPLLLRAGADPDRPDANGRTPGDWARTRPRHPAPGSGEWLWTGIRALDLFAPIKRGSLQWWPAAVGLGQFIMTVAVSAALGPEEVWYLGFDQRHIDANSIRHGLEETAMPGRIHLAPRGLAPAERRQRLADAVNLLRASQATSLVVVALPDEGHRHDIEVILPGLASDPRVLTTIVVEQFEGSYTSPGQSPPEGFDLQVAFDRRRARHPKINLFPAIDPLGTMSREYPSDLHLGLADSVRRVLGGRCESRVPEVSSTV